MAHSSKKYIQIRWDILQKTQTLQNINITKNKNKLKQKEAGNCSIIKKLSKEPWQLMHCIYIPDWIIDQKQKTPIIQTVGKNMSCMYFN